MKFFVICDNIRSLENIGSIFRTSDALGVDKIYLCGISGSPATNFAREDNKNINSKLLAKLEAGKPNEKIAKTALGADKTIPFEHHWHTWRVIDKLKKEGIKIISLERTKDAVLYSDFKPEFPLALVVGNEVKGVSENILKKSDKIIYLPMNGKKESLNVSVAFGVAGYEIIKNK